MTQHGVAPSSACIEKVQLTEADSGEGRSLHDGSMLVQQVSRGVLVSPPKPKEGGGGEQKSTSPFPTVLSSFPFTVNICELDECFHAGWQRDSPPQMGLPERVLSGLSSVGAGRHFCASCITLLCPVKVIVAGSEAKVPIKRPTAHIWTVSACTSARQRPASAPLESEQMEGKLLVWLTPTATSSWIGLFVSSRSLCHSEDVHTRKERHKVKQTSVSIPGVASLL